MACERAEPGGRLPEALDLQLRERRIRLGGGEVAHHPDDVACRRRELREPPASHPGVDLEMDSHAFRDPLVGGDELQPRDASLADLALGHRPHHEDASVAKRRAQVERLRQRRDAQGGRPRVERGLRHVDGAVAVALRLHDGPELGALGGLQEGRGVPPDRPEIEGEARPLHALILARPRSPSGDLGREQIPEGGRVRAPRVDSRKTEIPEWGSRSRADP